MQYDLTSAEETALLRSRMSPDQRNIDALTRAEAARVAMVDGMKPAQREAYEAQRAEQQIEQARVAKLSADQRKAEQLVRQ